MVAVATPSQRAASVGLRPIQPDRRLTHARRAGDCRIADPVNHLRPLSPLRRGARRLIKEESTVLDPVHPTRPMSSENLSAVSLEPLLDRAREPIYLVGPDRAVVYANRACETLTGRSANELVGLRCRWHGPGQSGDLAGLAGSLCPPPEAFAGESASLQTLIVHPGGERRWRRIDFFPCRDEQANLLVILAMVSNGSKAALERDGDREALHTELLRLRDRLHERYGLDQIIAASPAMRRVLDQVRAASQVSAQVLIVGPRGSGKELIARSIHYHSSRAKAPFVPVDCAALAPDVLERELFGGAGGRSSSAAGAVRGLLEGARGGTICLKEIGALQRDLQARLLPLAVSAAPPGARSHTDESHLRLMATTTAAPAALVGEDRLRPDLYYALSTLTIEVPPLRERKDDLPLLAQHFLEAENATADHQVGTIADDAWQVLKGYDWPGNVAELAATIAAAHARSGGDALGAEHLPARIKGALGAAYLPAREDDRPIALDDVLVRVERKLIEMALRRARGNKSQAADLLGISRPRLYRRMELLGLVDPSDGAASAEVST